MILYHGSTVVVEDPEADRNKSEAIDFGAGFYTTTSYEQAERWARTKMRRSNKDVGYVSVYEFDYTAAKEAGVIRTFDGANAKWLDYVTANRAKIHHGPIHGIDVGPVADDDVTRTIKLYESGVYTKKETIRRLKTEQLKDQWVFHDQELVRFLKFVRYDIIEKE